MVRLTRTGSPHPSANEDDWLVPRAKICRATPSPERPTTGGKTIPNHTEVNALRRDLGKRGVRKAVIDDIAAFENSL